ncbi:DUF4142 domain-containing protein [Ramlibacter sp. B156]|uniref:DUF4142 domain-containing protein n=1 Tax=Ramlibacter montanisoli TaxID=2732512 RepID=A0A849KGF7_9BURK|nr:DUF4142 domain-containing protein [Ramlibacter montanisoli]
MAQPGTGTRNLPGKGAVARADRKFIGDAVNSGMFEVQVSQLAASKATDPNVKSFAGMLVDHHTAANNELVRIANARGVELPAAPRRAAARHREAGEEEERRRVRPRIRAQGGHQGAREGHQAVPQGGQGREGSGAQGLRGQDPADAAGPPGRGAAAAAVRQERGGDGCRQELAEGSA